MGCGQLIGICKYDVFGSVRAQTGATTSKHEFVGALGHPSEAETGLVYMRARYMDPATGRFEGEDPEYHGTNWLAYCHNSPVSRVDASGSEDGPSEAWYWYWWTAGNGMMAASIVGIYLAKTSKEFMVVTVACLAAAACYGMAAVGLSWQATAAMIIANFLLSVAAVVMQMALAEKAGLLTIAAAAITANFIEATVDLGYIASIGADIPD